MTKGEYLGLRGSTSFNLLYEYYKEHYDQNKHQLFLSFNEFVQFMQMWPGIRGGYDKVVRHYDEKFNIVTIQNKEGQTIGYL